MVGTKAQSELIPLVEQNSITKNSCNEQFYLFDFSGESNVNNSQTQREMPPTGKPERIYRLTNNTPKGNMTISQTPKRLMECNSNF